MNRRHFLTTASVTLGALIAERRLGAARTIGARRLDRPGLQLSAVREDLARNLERTLSAVAAIGYREVELFSPYATASRTPRELRAAFDRAGLVAPAAHVGSALLYRGWERHLDAAATLGCRYVVCASVTPDERRTVGDWHELADLFNRAGESACRVGLRFGYHYQDFELADLRGTVPCDLLLARTDPALVRLELDLHSMGHAGADPLTNVARWPGRFFAVHANDVGARTIDLPELLERAATAGVEHCFVGYDARSGSALEKARQSFTHMRRLES